jgi:Ca-activated chloride channel family protein
VWITKQDKTYKARTFTGVKTIVTVVLLVTSCVTSAICVRSEVRVPNHFRVDVDMVTVTFTVTDDEGRYVRGLQASDVRVTEDGIIQTIATFAEGRKLFFQGGENVSDSFAGTNVFVLFDTSNCMYKGFAYASDAIADFIRHLDRADLVAVYTFSRNLFRAAPLTKDHSQAIFGLRDAVAGDDTALYNTLLLTLRDAAKIGGRKAVVVFSNGPDNASVIAPDDVRAVAEDEGIPIYVISTDDRAKDAISTAVFQRITVRTGGKLYWAQTWKEETKAFSAIREDIGSSYAVAYYPGPNPNQGFRTIKVEIVSGKQYVVRARPGYRARFP